MATAPLKIRNAMEEAVKAELLRVREEFADDGAGCACQLCHADTIALSLSTLPPRYFTNHGRETAIEEGHRSLVREGVARAREQVQHHPKHRKGEAVTGPEEVWIVNFPLEEGFHLVQTLLREHHESCSCWKCRCDMVAFTLNRYPARYGVEHRGRVKMVEDDLRQMREELRFFLNLALHVVTAFPHH